MEHFRHEHPLVLSEYNNNSPPDAHCYACGDSIIINTNAYHCIRTSITDPDSPCTRFFLHNTCAFLPTIIQHHLHEDHLLTLILDDYIYDYQSCCGICSTYVWFYYYCTWCDFSICPKCASLEREIKHPSHTHNLTLLPLKAILHICQACGKQGTEDFSYLCKTCFFWIHRSCALAPLEHIRGDHHNDHPLVLAYSLPKEYRDFGVSCSLCPEKVEWCFWLYYCGECRYFAHVQCALSPAESAKDGKEETDEEDVEESDLVHLPVSENEPHLVYQMIQQFTKKFSISTDEKADRISECHNGHPLILFDDFNNNNAVETNSTSEKRMICDGCVQPLLSPPSHPFYGCPDCNFFLHSVCAAEIPVKVEQKELTRLTKKALRLNKCTMCDRYCNGIVYSHDSYGFKVCIACAALPSKIKHDSHRHTLQLSNTRFGKCRGCGHVYRWSSICNICDYWLCIGCALKPGTIKHRWDEHQLILSYPPVKGHPQAFNCEICSDDIDPNFWFYFCAKCDTSFHTFCNDHYIYSNIKYGGIVKYDALHQHSLEFTKPRWTFSSNCNVCHRHIVQNDSYSCYKCVSCKFWVCMDCVESNCN